LWLKLSQASTGWLLPGCGGYSRCLKDSGKNQKFPKQSRIKKNRPYIEKAGQRPAFEVIQLV
jgi:hypothetical protein